MAKQREQCKWVGHSGLCYTYIVLELPCKLQTGQEGNYVFAKRNSEGRWVPVFVGHGDLSIACTPYNDQWDCILSHGATHFHCHLTAQAQARGDEQDDLLSRYRNAFTPYGCNTTRASALSGKGEGSGTIDLDFGLPPEQQLDQPLDLDDLNAPQANASDDNSGTQPRPI